MLGMKIAARRRARDAGEKPFWISFSDLMSALMVLFLVAMSVALIAVTKKISEVDREDKERAEAIAHLMSEIKLIAEEFKGVRVIGNSIDFGPRGRFEMEGQNILSAPQRDLLRQFTPKLLDKLRSDLPSQIWFKQAVVEGYASQTGKYLFNLNLSLERSARVLCELLTVQGAEAAPLKLADRKLIASKFFVGGASFNSLQPTDGDSRRIEFRLEFKTRKERQDEKEHPTREIDDELLTKALDLKERCPLIDR